jgi:UBX domain-containing protein 1
VGELYGFVTASTPQQRAFVLMTTFPSKELSDKNAKLEETELKKGGVVVQKWT